MSISLVVKSHMSNSLDPFVRMRRRGRLWRPWWKLRFHSFGQGSILVSPRWLVGCDYISIGQNVAIYAGAWLAAGTQSGAPSPSLIIGDGVSIRECAVISASERIVIEPYVSIAGRCVVIDSEHTWEGGNALIGQNPSITAPIRIGLGTWLAEQSIILKGTDIGAFSIVAASSVVRGHFPDFSILAGIPARVVGSTRDRLPEHLIHMATQTEGRILANSAGPPPRTNT
jgi:acetyltransferase-like isoleucine patch superfamily enzyme